MPDPAGAEYTPPLTFANDILSVNLWDKQQEVLAALPDHRRVAVKSGNGLGKGYSAAVAVLWFLHCHNPGIVLSTAPTFRQVRHILWRQIRRLYRPARERLAGKMLDTRWELAEDRYAMGLSAESADEFQGFHSPNMFIVVDEAEGVSDEIYEAIDAVMTSAEPRLLLIGNPTTTSGAFRRAFYEERHLYHTITISALDSPNVKAGKIITRGLTTSQWVQERKDTWGEENPIYQARVLGEFPDQAEDTLIKLSDVEAAAQLDPPGDAPDSQGPDHDGVVLSVDVARFGSDRSVILRRRGDIVEDIQTFREMDTQGPDHDGVVLSVDVARSAHQDDLFANLRAEGYWHLRDLFSTGQINIPQDNQLMGELAAMRYSYDSRGRIQIESKDSMRQRGLPSPDKADALMLAFLEPPGRTRLWT